MFQVKSSDGIIIDVDYSLITKSTTIFNMLSDCFGFSKEELTDISNINIEVIPIPFPHHIIKLLNKNKPNLDFSNAVEFLNLLDYLEHKELFKYCPIVAKIIESNIYLMCNELDNKLSNYFNNLNPNMVNQMVMAYPSLLFYIKDPKFYVSSEVLNNFQNSKSKYLNSIAFNYLKTTNQLEVDMKLLVGLTYYQNIEILDVLKNQFDLNLNCLNTKQYLYLCLNMFEYDKFESFTYLLKYKILDVEVFKFLPKPYILSMLKSIKDYKNSFHIKNLDSSHKQKILDRCQKYYNVAFEHLKAINVIKYEDVIKYEYSVLSEKYTTHKKHSDPEIIDILTVSIGIIIPYKCPVIPSLRKFINNSNTLRLYDIIEGHIESQKLIKEAQKQNKESLTFKKEDYTELLKYNIKYNLKA